MSLENEIKKNTAAIIELTAALNAQAGGTNATKPAAPSPATPAAPAAPASAAAPSPATPAAPAPAAAPTPPPAAQPAVAPAPAAAPQPAAVAQPAAPAAPQPGQPQMTHQQAQAELTTICQQEGMGTRVQAVMAKYGSPRLNEIPADSLFAMVQECKGLIQS